MTNTPQTGWSGRTARTLAGPPVTLPDDLRQGLDHAYAAAHLGVSWTPGNPESTSGLSKDEALQAAAEFLVELYDRVIVSESGQSGAAR